MSLCIYICIHVCVHICTLLLSHDGILHESAPVTLSMNVCSMHTLPYLVTAAYSIGAFQSICCGVGQIIFLHGPVFGAGSFSVVCVCASVIVSKDTLASSSQRCETREQYLTVHAYLFAPPLPEHT